MAVKTDSFNFKQEVLDSEGIVIADFYSDSCVPCKRMSPLLAELEESSENIKVAKINIGFEQELCSEYDVQAVPTLVFFKNGKELDRIVGAVSRQELFDTANKL